MLHSHECSRTNEEQTSPADKLISELTACALFAEALSLCLESAGVRPINLSQRLYVEPATIHNWRKNKRMPEAVMVFRIANAICLSSAQQQMLVDAWRVTRRARELIPCVEDAKRDGDVVSVLAMKENFSAQLAMAQRQLQSTKWDMAKRRNLPNEWELDLDPEIWLYSGY